MKRTIFLGLIILLIIGSCAQEKKSPIEGCWKLVYANWPSVNVIFPSLIKGGQVKMFSKDYCVFVGHFEMDTVANRFGGGTYKYEGNKFEFNRQYHVTESLVGTTSRWLTEIRNDTLIQRGPVDENWKLLEKYSTEKYIRLK